MKDILRDSPVQANVIAPNKHTSAYETMYKGHLLESETYIGGKVEALESGVFRSDLGTSFRVKPSAYQVDDFLEDSQFTIRSSLRNT